jgi:serine/threonine protein kinase
MTENHQRQYAPGSRIGEIYRIRTLLGRGGMGEVYLVENADTGDLRAMKLMRSLTDTSPEHLHRFRREALSMLNLGTHPFVVQLHELVELGSDTALVMEYIAPTRGCTSIEDYIERTQDYTDRLLGIWAVEFCVGLEHALAQGTAAHRDIKPANLLVGTDGFLKIADFGLALAASQVPAIIGTHAKEPTFFQQLQSFDGRSTCGTPGYIAPELLLGGHASVQSDMFSFGVTLWQLAARSMELPFLVPFRGDVAAFQREVLRSVQAGAVRPIDSPFFPVIRQCLHAEPDRRYVGLPAMREAIKDAAERAGLGTMDFMVKQGFRGTFDDYLNRGRAYLALGRRNRALGIFDRAVEHNPRSEQALEARGETLYERGDNAGALRDFKAASELNPEWDAPIIGIAKTLIEVDQIDLAIQHLDRVLIRHPGNLDALLEKSRASALSGQRDTALALLSKIMETNSRHALAHEYLGRLLWEEKDLIAAARALAYSLNINPLSTPTRLALAAVLTEGGQRKTASEQYLLAQAIHQGDPEGLNRVAAHMSEHGHAEEAIRLFREIAAMEQDSLAVILVNIGNAQINLGDEAAAAASFKEALKADPAYALAYRRLGNLEDWNDNHAQAAEYYTRACVYDPANSLNQSSAGTAYLRSGDPQKARDFLAASIRLLPEQPKILYNLAVAQLQCEAADNAIETLNQATRLDQRYFGAWYLKAQIEVQLDLAADAAHSVRQALAADPQMKTEQARQLLAFAREHGLQI